MLIVFTDMQSSVPPTLPCSGLPTFVAAERIVNAPYEATVVNPVDMQCVVGYHFISGTLRIECDYWGQWRPYKPLKCAPDLGLSASSFSGVTLKWTAASSTQFDPRQGIGRYNLEISRDKGASWAAYCELSETVSWVTVNVGTSSQDLVTGKFYWFRLVTTFFGHLWTGSGDVIGSSVVRAGPTSFSFLPCNSWLPVHAFSDSGCADCAEGGSVAGWTRQGTSLSPTNRSSFLEYFLGVEVGRSDYSVWVRCQSDTGAIGLEVETTDSGRLPGLRPCDPTLSWVQIYSNL